MQLRWSPTEWHMGDPPDQTAPSSGLSPALATERISLHDSTFQGRLVMVDVLTGHGDTIVIQQAKCVKIWGREGRLGHAEVFLQMCSFVTSTIERPRLFLCLQHARIRNPISTRSFEEPLFAPPVGGLIAQTFGWRGVLAVLAGIAVLMWVLALLAVPESLPPNQRASGPLRSAYSSLFRILANPVFALSTISFSFGFAAMMSYISASPFVGQTILGIGQVPYALSFTAAASAIILANL